MFCINNNIETALRVHGQHFPGTPRLFRAPGRVNIIGEHTDYNDGYVLPAALKYSIFACLSPRSDHTLQIWSETKHEGVVFDLDNPQKKQHWQDYVTGIAVFLEKAGHKLPGFNISLTGDLPLNAGLSSSAALEIAVANGLAAWMQVSLTKRAIADLCQQVEQQFVGVRCGIMDQYASQFGEAGRVLFLDCLTKNFQQIAWPTEKYSLVICNTMESHDLGAGAYNRRIRECRQGLKCIQAHFPGITSLRDVDTRILELVESDMPQHVYRRCRHVVAENERVREFVRALPENGSEVLGQLLYASHASLKKDYEVSSDKLDLLVEIAQKIPGVVGARMTGAGFGGCTVNVVVGEAVQSFGDQIAVEYEKKTGLRPEIYISPPAAGAAEISL